MTGPEYSPLDLEHVLAFERRWEEQRGAKDADVRATFGVSHTRYVQALHQHLDDPAALAADPMLVNRLIRLRDSRTEARDSRTFRRN